MKKELEKWITLAVEGIATAFPVTVTRHLLACLWPLFEKQRREIARLENRGRAVVKWYPFDVTAESRQRLPAVRKYVLVRCRSLTPDSRPSPILVGYLKHAAGEKNCPYFVTPGGAPFFG